MQQNEQLRQRLTKAIIAREDLLSGGHLDAVRLYNGFYEGPPQLVVDLYASTLVLYTYEHGRTNWKVTLDNTCSLLLELLPWVDCILHKDHGTNEPAARRGTIIFGGNPAEKIKEHGIWHAVDLMINQDASFYLDTRILRRWLIENAKGWRVLNTFAYTGSLGVAALAGGALQVEQVDRSRKFLNLARRSGMLNRLDIGLMKLRRTDFFTMVAAYKRKGVLFDCVIVDPPFFSATAKGTIDLVGSSLHVINKLRPLVAHGGRLVSINNALFLSGAELMRGLNELCEDGFLSIEAIIPVPDDITGYPETIISAPPRDPKPFNHPTKMVILSVVRKNP